MLADGPYRISATPGIFTFGLSLAAAPGMLNPSDTSVVRALPAIPLRFVALSTCRVIRLGAGRVDVGEEEAEEDAVVVGQPEPLAPSLRFSTRHQTSAASLRKTYAEPCSETISNNITARQ